ncbi:MAG: signal peptidase I [Elusimicrobia bacterium]|nr:signal peptidase I [Elusimicrobiota bacterium]
MALAFIGAFLLRAFAFERIVIVSGSMEPTLPVGTKVMVNKLAYLFHPPQRGDIVMFPSPVKRKGLVKRIVAVAGDSVRIVRKEIILNGQPLTEPYVQHTRPNELLKGDDLDLGRVPPGFVVLMGDNRDESGDSRDWVGNVTGVPVPFVPVKSIEGKMVVDK